jgi:prepilin-type N-terminal cleavage/methylation domain-containing protein
MNQRAFTLVETLVAIAIIMLALAAPFHTAEEALNASYISRDELIGNSLAQEGVEYVRSIRDNNYLYNQAFPSTPVTWLAGLDGTASAASSGTFTANCIANSCVVDPIHSTVNACSGSNCSTYSYLDLGTSSYFYPYTYNQQGAGTSNIASRFMRTIKLTTISTHESELTVTVSWSTAGEPHTTTINEYLENYL